MMNPPTLPAQLGNGALLTRIEADLQTLIEELEPPPPRKRGRGATPVLPALALWAGMVVCVVRGFSSHLALWRLLAVHGLWGDRYEIGAGAVYDRLDRGTAAPLEALFARLSQVLQTRLEPYVDRTLAPFATEVVAIDETVLDQVCKLLPALHGKVGRALLPGRLASVFDLRRQQWCRAQMIDDVDEREQLHARDLICGIPRKSLILFDLGYFAFAWFDDLTHAGYWWISRLRSKATYTVVHTFYEQDGVLDQLVWLGAYRADQAGEMARLVRFQVGKSTHSSLTYRGPRLCLGDPLGMLDPTLLPLHEIARLYARRWDIELAFKLLKRELKLHLLWSAKPQVLAQQVWATLIIAQVVLAMWVEIAGRAQVDVFEVSLALLVQYAPKLAADGQDPMAVFVEQGKFAKFIRPSRRTRTQAPVIPPEELTLAPPGLLTSRPARYASGQGSIPITPAPAIDFSSPPRVPIDPSRRGQKARGAATRHVCPDS